MQDAQARRKLYIVSAFIAIVGALALFFALPHVRAENQKEPLVLTLSKEADLKALSFYKENLAETNRIVKEWFSEKNTGPVYGVGIRLFVDKEKVPNEVMVADVFKNSPAEKAGVMEKDVILSVNGKLVHSAESLIAEMNGAGKEIALQLKRDNAIITIKTATVLLRGDKRKETAHLRASLETEYHQLYSRAQAAIDAEAAAINSGANSKALGTLSKATDEAVDAHELWVNKTFKEAFAILEVPAILDK